MHRAGRERGNLQAQDRLDGGEESRDVERLEKDLCGDISILPWVEWCFSEENRVLQIPRQLYLASYCMSTKEETKELAHLFTQRLQTFPIHPTPYPLHVVPIHDHPMFHWVLDL